MSTSTALIPYEPMDVWAQTLAARGERRETAKQGPVQPCPLQRTWEFHVRVTTTERFMPEGNLFFGAEVSDNASAMASFAMTRGATDTLMVDGKGPSRGHTWCRDIPHWAVIDAPTVTLPDDDGRTLTITIRAHCWVDVRVRHHDRDEVIANVRVTSAWQEEQAQQSTTSDKTLRVYASNVADKTFSVSALELPEGCWEHVP